MAETERCACGWTDAVEHGTEEREERVRHGEERRDDKRAYLQLEQGLRFFASTVVAQRWHCPVSMVKGQIQGWWWTIRVNFHRASTEMQTKHTDYQT